MSTETRNMAARPCPCECNSGGFCGGCGHAGCGGRADRRDAVMGLMRVHSDVATAHERCGPDDVVVRLAPLHRWIVVSREDWVCYGQQCGWELERAPAPSWMLAQAAAAMIGLGFTALMSPDGEGA